MATNQNDGRPQQVVSYTHKTQTVYYLVLPCCDKYNVVYDKGCCVLAYPDGGFTEGAMAG